MSTRHIHSPPLVMSFGDAVGEIGTPTPSRMVLHSWVLKIDVSSNPAESDASATIGLMLRAIPVWDPGVWRAVGLPPPP